MEGNPLLLGAVVIAVVFALLLSGLWVGIALGMAGLLYLLLFLPAHVSSIASIFWGASNSFVLTAIPLFIFMGEILLRTGIGDRLYRGISILIDKLPGCLAQSNIIACSLFAAISGSSVATAATIGTVSLPVMIKKGYDKKITYGSLAAGGSLGILIPPSIAMILYGAMCEVSVGKLFAAGMIPGIILALIFTMYIVIRVIRDPTLIPRSSVAFGWKDRLSAIVLILPTVILILTILGGIYGGIFTPSEGAAVGAVGALIIGLLYRKLTFRILHEALLNALLTTSMIFLVILGAKVLSFAVSNAGIPRAIIELASSSQMPKEMVLLFIYLLYILLGCFFEGVSLLLMTIPITFPVVMAFGYDPIWFGVVIVILLEMAMLTPPVGLILYTIQGLPGDRTLSEVVKGVFPFFVIQCVALALFTAFPQIVLFLPSLMK